MPRFFENLYLPCFTVHGLKSMSKVLGETLEILVLLPR